MSDTKTLDHSKPTILFVAWGDEFMQHVHDCISESSLPECNKLVVTDQDTSVEMMGNDVHIIRKDFRYPGKERKLEAFAGLPPDMGLVLFLDVDIRVVGDISLGFSKAMQFGIAMAPAPHYCLEEFWGFGSVMQREGVQPMGQLVYNSGVIFFNLQFPGVREIFTFAQEMLLRDEEAPWGDQPYISLAMEKMGFNPYTLSPSFNSRGFGELISGSVRIWHSFYPVPENANALEKGYLHRYEKGALVRAVKVPS